MTCIICNSSAVDVEIESWTGVWFDGTKIETIRTVQYCKYCGNKEIIKETDKNNEKLIWFIKEKVK